MLLIRQVGYLKLIFRRADAKMSNTTFIDFLYLQSNRIIAKVVLSDLDLHFQGQTCKYSLRCSWRFTFTCTAPARRVALVCQLVYSSCWATVSFNKQTTLSLSITNLSQLEIIRCTYMSISIIWLACPCADNSSYMSVASISKTKATDLLVVII